MAKQREHVVAFIHHGGIAVEEGQQMNLNFEPGISQRFRTLRACMADGAYKHGFDAVATKLDLAPSTLSEKLTGGSGDRKRDVGLEEFEAYLGKTKDWTPIYYLIDKFLRDPSVTQQEVIFKLKNILDTVPALLASLASSQSQMAPPKGRK